MMDLCFLLPVVTSELIKDYSIDSMQNIFVAT